MALQILFFLITLAGSIPAAHACDICGCAARNAIMGVFPQFHSNMIGIRGQYRSSIHPRTALNQNGESQVYEDRFYTQELWLRYYPGKRWQFFGFIPYHLNQRIESIRTTTIHGIGDVYGSMNYTLWNTGEQVDKRWKNTWIAGLGLRLPTGKYQQRDETKLMLPVGLQAGTGAYSFLFQTNYTTRLDKVGLNANVQYWMNTKNELDLKPGNQFTSALSAFYWYQRGSLVLLPYTGATVEIQEQDVEFEQLKAHTGGEAIQGSLGIDLYYKRMLFQALYQSPLWYNKSVSQPREGYRLSVGAALFF